LPWSSTTVATTSLSLITIVLVVVVFQANNSHCLSSSSSSSSNNHYKNQMVGSSPNALLSIPNLRHSYYALRHGQSLANVAQIISSEPSISTVRHGLSDLGQQQATAAGVSLAASLSSSSSSSIRSRVTTGTQPRRAAVFSSDFCRALETAHLVVNELKKKNVPIYRDGVVLETRLRERYFGTLNGGELHTAHTTN